MSLRHASRPKSIWPGAALPIPTRWCASARLTCSRSAAGANLVAGCPLLSDPVRGVRIRAIELLADIPVARLPTADRERFEHAAADFVAAQRTNADRPEARATLANFLVRQYRDAEAEAEYQAALRLSPQFAPAAVNLASSTGCSDATAMANTCCAPRLRHRRRTLDYITRSGLPCTRLKQRDEALDELRRATELEPDRARYAYVYGVALQSAGRLADAITALKGDLVRNPGDRDSSMALINFVRESGDVAAALEYAEELARIAPHLQGLNELIQQLRRQGEQPLAR